jgi:sugar/nucleoside kinase (ribokinase family)
VKTKKERYEVYVKVIVETSLNISADSFEEAIAKAKEYGVKDVVDFDTAYNDGSIEIIGVLK